MIHHTFRRGLEVEGGRDQCLRILCLRVRENLGGWTALDGDAVVDFEGVEVVVDKMSVPYLDGSSIDFEDTIQKQGFTIDNPNAEGSCACGDSFH